MNTSEMIKAVADKTGSTKAEVARIVDAIFGTDVGVITKTLKNGGRVQITGFGTFEPRKRAARRGRNPRTGEAIQIKASRSPAFKAGRGLKNAL